jgi:phosphonate transport system substrate-binding protein
MTIPKRLTAVSYLAPNMYRLYEAVCVFLGRALNISISLTQANYDALDDPAIANRRADLVFVCGLPLARLSQAGSTDLTPLVAPVMSAPRYGDQPIYFADVIVKHDHPAQTLADLQGRTFCYNDPGSNSGHNLLRYHLLQRGYPAPFFSAVFESGSHQNSMTWVAGGAAECAAIDSLVLEQAMRQHPSLALRLRIVESVGPCPAPPLALSTRLDEARQRMRAVLLEPDMALRAVMSEMGVKRFAPVASGNYETLYAMFQMAEQANYHII